MHNTDMVEKGFDVDRKSILMIQTRDELIKVDLTHVAYVESEGNYCRLAFINGVTSMVLISMSKFETLVEKMMPSSFCRIGKRHIVNKRMFFSLNIPKQQIVLTDLISSKVFILNASKDAIKQFKEQLIETGI